MTGKIGGLRCNDTNREGGDMNMNVLDKIFLLAFLPVCVVRHWWLRHQVEKNPTYVIRVWDLLREEYGRKGGGVK